MSADTIALVISIVGSSSAAVWLIRSKMSDVELTLTKLVEKHGALETRVSALETPRRRRR
jgi:hypothetical protein